MTLHVAPTYYANYVFWVEKLMVPSFHMLIFVTCSPKLNYVCSAGYCAFVVLSEDKLVIVISLGYICTVSISQTLMEKLQHSLTTELYLSFLQSAIARHHYAPLKFSYLVLQKVKTILKWSDIIAGEKSQETCWLMMAQILWFHTKCLKISKGNWYCHD